MELDNSGRRNRRRPPRGPPVPSAPGDPFAPRAGLSTTAAPGDPFAPRASSAFPASQADPFAPQSQSRVSFAAAPLSQQPAFPAATADPFAAAQSAFAAPAPPSAFAPAPPPAVQPPAFGASIPAAATADPFGTSAFAAPPAGSFPRAAPFGAAAQPSTFAAASTTPGDPFTQPSGALASTGGPSALGDPFAATVPRRAATFGAPASAAPQEDPFARKPHRTDAPPASDRPRSLSTALLLKAVPLPLFSRNALRDHFEQVAAVVPANISLRGSRDREGRRTALVSFGTPQETSVAMSKGRYYQSGTLPMSYYRPPEKNHAAGQQQQQQQGGDMHMRAARAAPPPQHRQHQQHEQHQQVPESKELLFSFVPEDLYSEEAVRHLFNSISGNEVTGVSIRCRRSRGAIKRTAIVTFSGIPAARTALEALPLYKGQKLEVNYRARPVHLLKSQPAHGAAARVPRDSMLMTEAENHAVLGDSAETIGTGLEVPMDYNGEAGPSNTGHFGRHGNDDDQQDNAIPESDNDGVGDPLAAARAERELRMARLRADIKAKERQKKEQASRAKSRQQGKQGRRETLNGAASRASYESGATKMVSSKIGSKQVVRPERRDGSEGWRKVGEKVSIQSAVRIVGTCQTMCPAKELEERIMQRDISIFETVDGDGGEADPAKAVKKYRRSAAISEAPSPDEIRPPLVLLKTMDHLLTICDSEGPDFVDIHNFVRDRTRSLRQDFTYQGVHDESCIKILEQSVRFHVMSEHRLIGTDPEKFSSKQNREQLDKCLISLREMYDLRREENLPMPPNEPEMQAYYILMQMSTPKTVVQLCTGFAPEVRRSVHVQFALQVVRAASDTFGNYYGYFACVRSAPYLTACLMHSRFPEIRSQALNVINSTHGNSTMPEWIEVSAITDQLGFEDDEEAMNFCELLGMDVKEEQNGEDEGSLHCFISTQSSKLDSQKASEWKAARSDAVIESKVEGLKPSEIIAGLRSEDFDMAKMPHRSSSHLKSPMKSHRKAVDTSSADRTSAFAQDKIYMAQQEVSKEAPAQGRQNRRQSVLERLGASSQLSLQPTKGNAKEPLAASSRGPSSSTEQGSKSEGPPPSMKAEEIKTPTSATEEAKQKLEPPQKTSPLAFPFSWRPEADKQVFKRTQLSSTPALLQAVNPSVFAVRSASVADVARNQPAASTTREVEDNGLAAAKRGRTVGDILSTTALATASSSIPFNPSLPEGEKKSSPHMVGPQLTTGRPAGPPPGQPASMRTDDERGGGKTTNTYQEFLKDSRNEELERARILDETNRKGRLLAHEVFSKVVVQVEDVTKDLRERLSRIDTRSHSISIESDGAAKVAKECESMDQEFAEIVRELKACIHELDEAKPVSEFGTEARTRLRDDIQEIKELGNELWRQVWDVKGLAIVAPRGVAKVRRLAGAKRRTQICPSASALVKRKAHLHEGMSDVGERAKKHAPGRFSANAASQTGGELKALRTAMRRHGLVRWEGTVLGGYETQTETERMLHVWVRNRLHDRKKPSGLLGTSIRMAGTWISVAEQGVSYPVPLGSNVIIFSVDTSSSSVAKERLRQLDGVLAHRQNNETSPPLIVIVLCCRTPLNMGPGQERPDTAPITESLQSHCARGVVSHFHVVEVSVTCARYVQECEQFTAAIIKSAPEAHENLKKRERDLKPTSLGEIIVHTGNSAWIRYISSSKEYAFDEGSYREVIDCVNKAWWAVSKTIDEEEQRWATGMDIEKRGLREARDLIRQKMRLPLPTEISADTPATYIRRVAQGAGVICPALRSHYAQPLAHFCRCLGHILMPFVSSVLQERYFTTLYLPRVALRSNTSSAYKVLRWKLADEDADDVKPPVNVERGWDGTPIVAKALAATSQEERFGRRWTDQGVRQAFSTRRMGSTNSLGTKPKQRRKSMDFLKRTLDFSPASGSRRKSLPISRQKAHEMFAVFDEMCRAEEEHARLLKETEGMLQNRATTGSAAEG